MTTKKPDDDWLDDEPKHTAEKPEPTPTVPPRPVPPDHKSDPSAPEAPKSDATGPWGRDAKE